MKILIPCENGKISQDVGSCKEFLLFETENKEVVKQTILRASGNGITSLFGFFNEVQADIMICGDISRRAKNTILMLGFELIPGCEGDPKEAVAKFLKGIKQGKPELLEDPESEYTADDPMNCMHECEKCTLECHSSIKDLAEIQRKLKEKEDKKS